MKVAPQAVADPVVENVRVLCEEGERVAVVARPELDDVEPQDGLGPRRRLGQHVEGARQEHARFVVRALAPVAESELAARGGGGLRLARRFKERGAFADKVFRCGLRAARLSARAYPAGQCARPYPTC